MTFASLFDAEPAERLARLRSLRLASRLLCGPRGTELERALHAAEHNPAAVTIALAHLDALAPLDRRRVLASWGRTL